MVCNILWTKRMMRKFYLIVCDHECVFVYILLVRRAIHLKMF